MAQLDAQRIKKAKRGELCGTIAIFFCAAVLIYFAAVFSVSWITKNSVLQTLVFCTAPPLAVIGTAVAAFCNIKFGGELDRATEKYIRDVMVENAALMHPERDSLSFRINLVENQAEIAVNGYKEKIIFDFSAFGKLGLSRKAAILSAIQSRITITFMILWERGSQYKSVAFTGNGASRRKDGKVIPIITDGKPEKSAVRHYLQHK